MGAPRRGGGRPERGTVMTRSSLAIRSGVATLAIAFATAAAAAEVDLRYQGSKRVLVLVDGLRYVNSASASGVPGSTDLNSIPESMIDRIEVLQDGASAVYGSDAIAGVVNIITRKKQQGLRLSAQAGVFGQGDGATYNFQGSWGTHFGGTDIVVGGNYVRQDGISSGDRSIS